MEHSSGSELNQGNKETENKGKNFSNTANQCAKINPKIIIGVSFALLVVGIVIVGFLAYRNQFFAENGHLALRQTLGVSVFLRENRNDTTKTDVYLRDPRNNQEVFHITLANVHRYHYHSAEYHNGNLYIIRRIGDAYDYQDDTNWTDELWRYNAQKQGVKLFSSRGLDFRVSADESFIAIIGSEGDGITEENLIFLRHDGSVFRVFTPDQVGVENLRHIGWSRSDLWVNSGFGPGISSLIKFDTTNFEMSKFDVAHLSLNFNEFDLNTEKEKIAFSNFPFFFDVESEEEYVRSGAIVNLTVYDLNSRSQQSIATSTAKGFEPKWIDDHTLEYNDPGSAGRVTTRIP